MGVRRRAGGYRVSGCVVARRSSTAAAAETRSETSFHAMCAWEAFICHGNAPSREARERPEGISTVATTRASPPRRGVPRSPRGSPSSSRVVTRRASTNVPASRRVVSFLVLHNAHCYNNCGVLRASGPIEAVFSLLSGSFHPRRAQCDARASGASSRRARWRFARSPSVIARARSMAPRDALRRWIGAPTGAPPVVSETAQRGRV